MTRINVELRPRQLPVAVALLLLHTPIAYQYTSDLTSLLFRKRDEEHAINAM
jgi:hypothetical protein